ncbi:MAG: hypothetical protein GX808_13910 [Syntrophomonadaceae bacterium]|nr:hypothetical protein [Syntrophomonadaceae bacterium]
MYPSNCWCDSLCGTESGRGVGEEAPGARQCGRARLHHTSYNGWEFRPVRLANRR